MIYTQAIRKGNILRAFIGITLWLIVCSVYADALADSISEDFRGKAVDGTLLVVSAEGDLLYIHNPERAAVRFSPASTFKVLNTLIALDVGVVSDRHTQFVWDGVDRGSPTWNRDQTLESAFKVSCVWCYQEIARQVGRDRYAAELHSVDYGNQQIGPAVARFWLDGSLAVSGHEQIEFLRRLYARELPYQERHIAELIEIMQEERTTDYTLYAKSGWTGPELGVGWYIGFVETEQGTALFAMNMRMDRIDQAPLRKSLVLSALRQLELVR